MDMQWTEHQTVIRLFCLDEITALHSDTLSLDGWPREAELTVHGELLPKVLENHRLNSMLWLEEDQARRNNVSDSSIAANKRAIDRYNQGRNDAIEAIDEVILSIMEREGQPVSPEAWVNSETAGSLIDRLSIGSLKIHHMRIQCQRTDASADHVQRCTEKLAHLKAQHAHLSSCLRSLLAGMLEGSCTYRAHRQFKMYNDPSLNPYLYRASSH